MSRLPRFFKHIKSVQYVAFTGVVIPNTDVTATATQTINPVNLNKSVVVLLSTHGGYYADSVNKYRFSAGVELQDAATVKLSVKSAVKAGGPFTKNFAARVIEFEDKPKSLQMVSGNDATSQTINTVNPAKAEIYRAFEIADTAAQQYNPTLNAASVSWDTAAPAAFRLYVVEWY